MGDPKLAEIALIAAVAGGDGDAFRILYRTHQPAVFRLACGVLLDPDEAGDVVQEVFLRLHAAAKGWEPRANVSTWLYRVTLNASLNLRRRLGAFRRHWTAALLSRAHWPDSSVVASETLLTLERALRSLPPKQRAIVTLHLDAGLAPVDIADAVGISANDARVTLHRALARLRDALKSAGITVEPPDAWAQIEETRT